MQIVEIVQGTDLWHSFRLKGIGASEAPIIEGISPYRSKRDLFLEKTGKPTTSDNEDKSYIFALGHKTEGIIRKEFQDLMKVEMKPICVIHPKYDYLRASLDGFDPKHGVLEAKLVSQEVLKNAKNGEIPNHHYSQIQHQLEVTGADIAQYFAHDGKKNGALVEIRKNQEYINNLLDLEHAFWADVKNNNIPALSEMDYLVPENDELLRELRDAKEHAENTAMFYEELKAKIISTYGHSKIAGGGIKIFKSLRQGTLNLLKVPEIEKAANEIKEKLDLEYLEKFRSKSSESWTVKIDQKV
jgi:putative phage-type endonuclease